MNNKIKFGKRLQQLHALQPGWFDGDGTVPDTTLLAWLAKNLVAHYPSDIAPPLIAALPEGGVCCEWISKDLRVTAEIRNADFCAKLHSTQLSTEVSATSTIDLRTKDSAHALLSFVRKHTETTAVQNTPKILPCVVIRT